MTEQEAIERLRRGDIAGLKVLVERHELKAVRTATLITRNRTLAEEVVQAAFLRVYHHITQFDRSRSFEPWFLRIVVNDALKLVQRRQREVPLDEPSANGQVALADVLPSAGPGPAEQVLAADLEHRVQAALDRLTAKQRAVIVMRYYLDMSGADMARELGIGERAVKARLTSARKRLRTLLREEQVEAQDGR